MDNLTSLFNKRYYAAFRPDTPHVYNLDFVYDRSPGRG
jgi:hypothetical protein